MKLYDKDFRYTETADVINRQCYEALKPIFAYWIEKEGANPRDIHYLADQAALDLSLNALLKHGVEKAKKRKEKK